MRELFHPQTNKSGSKTVIRNRRFIDSNVMGTSIEHSKGNIINSLTKQNVVENVILYENIRLGICSSDDMVLYKCTVLVKMKKIAMRRLVVKRSNSSNTLQDK